MFFDSCNKSPEMSNKEFGEGYGSIIGSQGTSKGGKSKRGFTAGYQSEVTAI